MVKLFADDTQGVQTLFVLNTETGKPLWQVEEKLGDSKERVQVAFDAYSVDGKTFMSRTTSRVSIWDIGKKKRILDWSPKGNGKELIRSCIRSANGSLLAVHVEQGGKSALCILEVATAKVLQQWPIGNPYVCPMAFSADGKFLTAGISQLGAKNRVHVWNVVSGETIAPLEGAHPELIDCLAFSRDGKHIAAGTQNWGTQSTIIRLWDVQSKREVQLPSIGHSGAVTSVMFLGGGEELISGSRADDLRVWNASTGKQRLQFRVDDDEPGIAWFVSPTAILRQSGKVAFHILQNARADFSGEHERRISIRDIRTWKEVHRVTFGGFGRPYVTLSPQGTVLCGVSHMPQEFYDTGEPGPHYDKMEIWNATEHKKLHTILGYHGRFLANGKVIATILASEDEAPKVALWDAASGKKISSIAYSVEEAKAALPSLKNEASTKLTFSQDGSTLIAERLFEGTPGIFILLSPISISNIDGSQTVANIGPAFRVIKLRTNQWAISGDCNTLVWEGGKGEVHVLEVGSCGDRFVFDGAGACVSSFGFGPRDRSLATGYDDTTISVWDMTGGVQQNGRLTPIELSEAEADECWRKCAGENAARAGEAIWRLVAGGASSVRFLERRLHEKMLPKIPDGEALTKAITKLLSQLDDGAHAVRHRALKRLEEFGELAIPQIQQEMRKRLSADKANKLRYLLDVGTRKATAGVVSREQILGARVVEVLEQIGSTEAQRVLRNLAASSADAWTRQAAQRTVYRFKEIR